MNWSKAKTILIIALIVTNIFLLTSHLMRHQEMSEVTNKAALSQILAERGVRLETDLPMSRGELPVVQGEYLSLDDEDVQALIETQTQTISEESDEAYREEAEEFLTYLGVMEENVTFESVKGQTGGDVRVRFVNTIGGLDVAGNYMDCYFRRGRIERFEYFWLKPTNISQRRMETISAATALMTADYEQAVGMQIWDVQMVYWVPDTQEMEIDSAISDTAFPAWQITTSAGEKIYVEAV